MHIYSCSHINEYYQTNRSEDVLDSETLFRVSLDDMDEMKISTSNDKTILSMAHQCYQNPQSFDPLSMIKDHRNNKSNLVMWNSIGNCYYHKQDYIKSNHYLRIALGQTKDKAEKAIVINNMAINYYAMGQLAQAKFNLKEASQHYPSYNTPVFNLGKIYLFQGDANMAEKIFQALYQKNSNDPEVIVNLAKCYSLKKNYKKALELFRKVEKRYLARSDISLSYAHALIRIEDFDEAKKILSQINFYTEEAKNSAKEMRLEIAQTLKLKEDQEKQRQKDFEQQLLLEQKKTQEDEEKKRNDKKLKEEQENKKAQESLSPNNSDQNQSGSSEGKMIESERKEG